MTRIPFILLSTTDGSLITGATPTVTISKDGGAFTAATNAPAEIGNGYYYVDLTTTETTVTNNVIIRATATGAQPTAVVWEPEQAVPTAADNATAVWGASSRTLTNLNIQSELTTYGAAKTTDLTGLATSQDITNSQAVIIGAMPTTAGLATTSDVTTAQAAIIEAMPDVSGLSTFDAATDTVTIDATQAAGMATADVSGLATATAQAAQTAAINKLDSSVLHWAATASTLTLYDSNGAAIGVYDLTRDSSGNITAIEPHVETNG